MSAVRRTQAQATANKLPLAADLTTLDIVSNHC
jgi:hypothetical protein